MPSADTMQVRVRSVTWEAQGVLALELVAVDGRNLPPFTAGAHVDLFLPSGLVRSYSICNDQDEQHRYVIGVNRDANSRGGSRYLHEVLRAGDTLTVSHPRNNFPLNEDAADSLLISGGIGITPLLAMVRRLEKLGRAWRLYYCSRTRKSAAFLGELRALSGEHPDRITYNYDGDRGGKLLNLAAVISSAGPDTHLYCCGPLPMLEAFEQAASLRPPSTVHVEYFAAKESPSLEGGFEVELAKSGRTVNVPAGKSILDTLLDVGIQVPYSCMEGVCGSCETRVLAGLPDHRDLILGTEEKAANKTMMICCSGSKGSRLVLDL